MKLYIRRGLDQDDTDTWLVLERMEKKSVIRGEFYKLDDADNFIKELRTNDKD